MSAPAPQHQGLERAVWLHGQIDRLDKAVRVWAVRTYVLVSPGPPPIYQLPWDPDHVAYCRGWQKFVDNWKTLRELANNANYTPGFRTQIESYVIAYERWLAGLTEMGVRLNDPTALKILETPKIEAMPWTNTAVIVGGLAFAAYVGAPYFRRVFDNMPAPLSGPKVNHDAVKRAIAAPRIAARYERMQRARDAKAARLRPPSVEELNRKLEAEYGREQDRYFEGFQEPRRALPQRAPAGLDMGDDYDGNDDQDGDSGDDYDH